MEINDDIVITVILKNNTIRICVTGHHIWEVYEEIVFILHKLTDVAQVHNFKRFVIRRFECTNIVLTLFFTFQNFDIAPRICQIKIRFKILTLDCIRINIYVKYITGILLREICRNRQTCKHINRFTMRQYICVIPIAVVGLNPFGINTKQIGLIQDIGISKCNFYAHITIITSIINSGNFRNCIARHNQGCI